MHRYIERFSKERDYKQDIMEPLARLTEVKNIKYSPVGFVEASPSIEIAGVRVINHESNPYVFLSAGVHGDEPAGVKALMSFIGKANQYTTLNFVIIPCVNPIGYERNIREGSEFQDINREFYDLTYSPENLRIINYLSKGPYNYLFSMDLHETREQDNPPEEHPHNMRHPDAFHMWEVCEDKSRRIGRAIVSAVREVMPVCKWSRVWGDTNSGGVIYYPEGAVGKLYGEANVLQRYMNDNYTQHSFTTETCSGAYGGDGENLEKRIEAQLTCIKTAVACLG